MTGPPVGPLPDAATCLAGALLYASAGDASAIARQLILTDMDPPIANVLAAIWAVADAGTSPCPQLVLAELRRVGRLTKATSKALTDAVTAGALPQSAPAYAAAVLDTVWRARLESAAHALATSADTASETELIELSARVFDICGDGINRLNTLRKAHSG